MSPDRPRRICVVSGGRADYGLLSVPMMAIRDAPGLELQFVVTGQHLATGGWDIEAVARADGLEIAARVDMLLAADSAGAVTKSLGLATIGFADLFAARRPDLLMVLGDRYEILAPVQAALIARIPVAHLCGGDVTEGAFDEAIRHAVTKMSHLHFVTHAEAAGRLRRMGENPANIHVVGSPGLDRIRLTPPLPREAFLDRLGLPPRAHTLLVTFHPETLRSDSVGRCREMLDALESLGPDFNLILTGTNADPEGRAVAAAIEDFAARRDNALFRESLGQELYFSALRHADAVVGNSSSGLYEAPAFGVPTINIGDRQKGRPRAASVIDVPPERAAIAAAVRRALDMDRSNVVNPYGDGHAAERIVAVLKALDDPAGLIVKPFFDRPEANHG